MIARFRTGAVVGRRTSRSVAALAPEQEADDAAGKPGQSADSKLEELHRKFGEGWSEHHESEAENHGEGDQAADSTDHPAPHFVLGVLNRRNRILAGKDVFRDLISQGEFGDPHDVELCVVRSGNVVHLSQESHLA